MPSHNVPISSAGRWLARRRQRRLALERAVAIQRAVRVAKPQPPEVLVQLLGSCFTAQDSVDTIRQLCIGRCGP